MPLALFSPRVPGRAGSLSAKRLEGVWEVERVGGLLPPLFGVRKVIDAGDGKTTIGPFGCLPFDVCGTELRYRRPLGWFVDVLTSCDGALCTGKATVLGRTFGSFRMRRISGDPRAG